jgi:hypothetical protein
VDDQHVAVGLALNLAADARLDQPLEQARLAGPDDDQIGVAALRELEDLRRRVAQRDVVLGVEPALAQERRSVPQLLTVQLGRIDRVDRPDPRAAAAPTSACATLVTTTFAPKTVASSAARARARFAPSLSS